MINTSTKGRNHELEDIKFFQKQGYVLAYRSIRTRFQRIDFANLFDSVLYKIPETERAQWVFISSKTNGHYTSEHVNALRAFANKCAPLGSIVQLRDHIDSRWIFDRMSGNHARGCKNADKTYKKRGKNECTVCGRKLKPIMRLEEARMKVIDFVCTCKRGEDNETKYTCCETKTEC